MLKKDTNINKENIISLILVFTIVESVFDGKKPPDEINVIDKLNELKDLKSKIFKIIKIHRVKMIYKIKILEDCLKSSDVLNERKFVNDFFKLSSNISINKIIENKK